jgi:signal transduction histidine kinase/energy-coupling factor transporter ATP-binding protein EcfA2
MNNYSKFTTNYIGKVIKTIRKDKKSVFLIGPNGMGKSTILNGAMDNLKDHPDYKCLHFDMRDAAGALDFYTRIIEKIDSTIPVKLTNRGLSSIFYEEFSNRVQNNNEQLIIFFDHVESVNRNFYDQFSIVFRRIIIEIQGQNSPLFVFCGSRVTTSPESSNLDTSPLWNVTEPIEVKPCRGKDLEKMISYHYKALTASDADKDSISFIARVTNGQTLLIRSLIRYISEMNITDFENETVIVNKYSLHYLSGHQNDNHLLAHIQHIMDKFKTMPLLLINMIESIRNNATPSENLPDRYDNTTISGILTINSQNNYCFSNAIYKSIFTKLLSREQYFLGDYCLYHYDNDYLWQTAKNSFIPYDKRKPFWKTIDPANINDLYPRIRQKLRHFQTSAELAHNFCEIIKRFFDINTFGIFTIKEKGKERKFVINQSENQFRIKGSECINEPLQIEITELVHQSVSNKLHMIDWTDSILVVPFTIHDDHKWVFVGLVDGISKDIYNSISDFVSAMFASYYSLLKREKADTYKMLRDQFTISVDDPGRGIMQNLWTEAVPNLQRAGLQIFVYYQFNPKNNTVIVTNSKNHMLSNEWQPASDSVIRAANFFIIHQKKLEYYDLEYYDQDADKFYLGKQLDNGLVIMFGYSQDNCQQDRIYELKSVYDMFFYVINKMSNSRRLLVRYKRMLYETTDDYIYFVDDQYHIIDSNKYFDDDFPKESDWQTQIKCYKQLMNSENPCSDCQVQNVIQTNEKANILRVIPDRTDKLDCTFTPIKSAVENQIIAVGIRMHPLGIHQTIVEEMPKLEKIDNVDLLEKKIMEILLKFGFKRVYLYKHESEQPGSYISNDAIGDDLTVEKITNFSKGEIGFFIDDPKTVEGLTFVWHRKNLDETNKSVIEKRLKGSIYELRETVDRMNYANKTLPKDSNFWISIPLLYDGIVEKLIILDNNNDIELDKKLIRLDLLQVLDNFARNAEQIRSNLKHRDYLRTLFRMMSHGTKEPLGMLRNSLFLMFQSTDENVKKEWYKTANAALGFTQSCLGSKLTLERGSGSVSKKPVSITDLLTEQTSFFKAYATHAANIDFQLCIEGNFIYNTDEIIFLQIINNLVSNSLRHLQKLRKQKEKWIKIEVLEQESGRPSIYITDNGEGLPVEVRHFFESPVHQQKNQLTGSFGLYDSQEMAKMLGGQLIYHSVDKGTKFEIQL